MANSNSDNSIQNLSLSQKIKKGFLYLGKGISTTKSKFELEQIKNSVVNIITSIQPKKSIINRITNYWSGISLWLKPIIGIALVLPPIALGIIFNIVPLIMIGIYAGILFSASWFFLSDHTKEVIIEKQEINKFVSPTIDGIGLSLEKLDALSGVLQTQLEYLKEENEKLKLAESNIQTQNKEAKQQQDILRRVESGLNEDVEKFSKELESLNQQNKTQKEILAEQDLNLEKINTEREENERQFKQQIADFNTLIDKLSNDCNALNLHIENIKNANLTWVKFSDLDDEKKDKFKEKLEKFVQEREDIIERASELNKRSIQIMEETKEINTEINNYRSKLQELCNKMTKKVQANMDGSNSNNNASDANTKLINNGFFCSESESSNISNSSTESATIIPFGGY